MNEEENERIYTQQAPREGNTQHGRKRKNSQIFWTGNKAQTTWKNWPSRDKWKVEDPEDDRQAVHRPHKANHWYVADRLHQEGTG